MQLKYAFPVSKIFRKSITPDGIDQLSNAQIIGF